MCVDRRNNLYFILPNSVAESLSILRSSCDNNYQGFERVWNGNGYDGEPLPDIRRLEASDVLSVFTRTSAGNNGYKDLVVLDINLAFENVT